MLEKPIYSYIFYSILFNNSRATVINSLPLPETTNQAIFLYIYLSIKNLKKS